MAEALVRSVEKTGGEITLREKVLDVRVDRNRVQSVHTDRGEVFGKQFLLTSGLPIVAKFFEGHADSGWITRLRRVKYLGNMCLALRLKQSLSETYWLNVNGPGFPFVGVIEHTNFDLPENYKGTHIAFLSRYLPVEDAAWQYTDEQNFKYALEHLHRMFPAMELSSR